MVISGPGAKTGPRRQANDTQDQASRQAFAGSVIDIDTTRNMGRQDKGLLGPKSDDW
jgi:hypothetical protein